MKLFPHQSEALERVAGHENCAWVVGYEGLYSVDESGNVYSTVTTTSRRMGILKPHIKNGYPAVNLFKDGKQKHHYIHRLVAEAFVPNPDNLPEVNHKDCDKTNNQVSNLEWCDRHWNLQHSYDHGLKRTGETHGCARLTEDDVREIRALRGKVSGKEISQMFGVAQCTVSAIQLHRIWKGVI
jgi:hypothetical protein